MNDLVQTESRGLQGFAQKGFMQFDRLDDAYKCCDLIAKSTFCPKAFMGKAGDVMVAVQMGLELGLQPMQALANIAVINGRASLWGDAMLAVCKASPHYEYCHESFDSASETATCTVKRRGEPEQSTTFSKAKAQRAKLWGKAGPWTDYPERMLQMRARGFALRDMFPDLLRGFTSVEEARDIPVVRDNRHVSIVPITRLEAVKAKALEKNKAHTEEERDRYYELAARAYELIEALAVPEETIQKWLNKANVSCLEEMDLDTITKCVHHMESQLLKVPTVYGDNVPEEIV